MSALPVEPSASSSLAASQYYINISGEATGPYDFADIQNSLAGGEIDLETQVCAADGQFNWVTLGVLLNPPLAREDGPKPPPFPAGPAAEMAPPPPTAAAAEPPVMVTVPPREYMRFVRGTTCYGFLRGVVDFLCALLILGTVAGAVVGIGLPYLKYNRIEPISAIGTVIGFVVTVVFWIGARSAVQMVIDVADTLIHDHARKYRG
jgi:hypothetical protein